jgi:threonine dehydrogenase-like Zn-dependent dehydrogenase
MREDVKKKILPPPLRGDVSVVTDIQPRLRRSAVFASPSRDSISPARSGRSVKISMSARIGTIITVDASASADGIRFALPSLATGGCCTGVGYYFFKNAKFPLAQMYFNTTTLLLGVSNPRSDLPDLLALISSRRFQPEKVTTVIASWEDAPQAFLEDTTKVVVRRSSAQS